MTIWFYVKTSDDPKVVGDIVCSFQLLLKANILEISILGLWKLGKMSLATGKSKANMHALKDLTEIGIVYRIGDTVVLSEIDDDLAPDFLDPLITKYGFDNVKWIVVPKIKK